MKHLFPFVTLFALLLSCTKKDTTPAPTGPQLRFKFHFDSTQARLNNIGQPAVMPGSNAGQSPHFNSMSAHYIELAPNAFTALGSGAVLYRAAETTTGGSNAIDFALSTLAADGGQFYTMNLSNVPAGTYQWLRISLAYQNYDLDFLYPDPLHPGTNLNLTGTCASFIGFNTYINSVQIKTQSFPVVANKLQGFWAFETSYAGVPYISSGQAPANATTVVNPLATSSPVPAGSCVVTAAFTTPLVITGSETSDIVVDVHLSTNKSFEWHEVNFDGKYEPAAGEYPVDMGVRGMIPDWH